MPSKKNIESLKINRFLNTLQKGIRTHGIEKIADTIHSINILGNDKYGDEIRDYIFRIVTKEYRVTDYDLVNADKRGDVTLARNTAIILLYKNLQLSDKSLGLIFNRVRQVPCKVRTSYSKSVDSDNLMDKDYCRTINRLNRRVVKYVKDLKNK